MDARLEAKIAVYLRRIQVADGGSALFHGGEFDISASVKGYFALKMIGDDPDRAAHAPGARGDPTARRSGPGQRLHARASGPVGVVGWRAVPVMPVEIILAPRWFPFHLDKISYWARTVIAPLLFSAR